MPKLSELVAQSGGSTGRVKLSDVAPEFGPAQTAAEYSPLERFGLGMQRGVRATGEGVGQMGLNATLGQGAESPWGEAASNALIAGIPGFGPARNLVRSLTKPEQRNAMTQAGDAYVREQKRIFDAGLGQYTSAKAGDVAGSVLATAPLGIAGKSTSWLGTLGRGAATGAMGAATQPVTGEGDYAAQKGLQMGLGALFGGGTAGALRGVGAGLERLLPRNLTAQMVNASQRFFSDPRIAKEGEALAQRTGVTGLSPAAISGSPVQTMGENMARQSIFSRDMALKADQRTAQQIHDYVGRVMQSVRGGSVSADEAGKTVQSAIKSGVNRLAQIRESQAAKDYGVVRQMIGNGPSPIRPIALADKLQGLVDEYGGIPGGDAQKISRWAQGALNDLEPMANDLQKLIRFRSYVSKASKGAANLFDQVNPGENRRVAAQLVGAIESDLDRASMELPGHLGSALKAANANYSAVSKSIDAVEKSPLGRLLGDDIASEVTGGFNTVAPEKVIDRIRGMTPSEIGMTRTQLERWSPDAWAGVKRRVLEDALSVAETSAPSAGVNTLAMHGGSFINTLAKTPQKQAQLRAMFEPREQAQIEDAFSVIRRFGDKTGYNHSGTAPMNEAISVLNSLKEWTVKGAASAGGAVFGSRSIARLMLDANGRQAVMKLVRLPPQSMQAQQAAAYITALLSAPEAANELTSPEQQPSGGAPGQQYGGR